MAHQVSAIIPAHNEADIISDTVRAALSIPGVDQVIVVDDASTDGTGDAARSAGAHKVLTLEHNLGKGGALNEGWRHSEGDILLLLDADLGASASEASNLLNPVLDGSADMTIAVFGRVQPPESLESDEGTKLGAKSRGLGMVVRVARWGIKAMTGQRFETPLSGQRALKREIIEKSGGFASKFGVEVNLTIDALRMGYRVSEVPVAMVHRPSGRDIRGILHRGRQFLDVLRVLCIKALRS